MPSSDRGEGGIVSESTHVEQNDADDLVTLSVESWKLIRLFQRAVGKLEPSEQVKFVNQARYFQKKIDAMLDARGIRLQSLEGMPFEPGLAATPLNLDEFDGGADQLFVVQMIEPVVMGPSGVVKTGTCVLGVM